ncbi:MAG: hypothetical protein AB7K24_07975 [Gemmataceae bacterium]
MKYAVAISVLGSAALLAFSVLHANQSPGQVKAVSVAELNRRQVIGYLGQPLGEIVTVEGVVADEQYRGIKADLGQLLLRIQAVNGKQLPNECVFHFLPAWVEIGKPTVGSRFKYVGYETGGFTGTPARVFDYIPAHCTTGYCFTTSFVALRDELIERKEAPGAAPAPASKR